MLEVADIFRLHGPEYRARFGARMLPSHLRAMQDIETCRTASLGGQLYYCVKALSRIFRAKFRDALKKTALFVLVEARVWQLDWVIHSEPVGSGAQAFKYLAPYIFRVAISNNRLRKLHDGQVTFSYKESATDQLKRCTVSAAEFIRRFLQHVLPPHFIKVRYYGLLSPAHRQLLQKARQLLPTTSKLKSQETTSPPALLCPHCRQPLTLLGPLAPRGRTP